MGRSSSSVTATDSVPGTTAVGETTAAAEQRAAAIGQDVSRLRDKGGFAGTASEVVDYIGSLSDLGVTRIYFQIMDLHDVDHLDFLAREVVPQLS